LGSLRRSVDEEAGGNGHADGYHAGYWLDVEQDQGGDPTGEYARGHSQS
jgi:hypothetical protein